MSENRSFFERVEGTIGIRGIITSRQGNERSVRIITDYAYTDGTGIVLDGVGETLDNALAAALLQAIPALETLQTESDELERKLHKLEKEKDAPIER